MLNKKCLFLSKSTDIWKTISISGKACLNIWDSGESLSRTLEILFSQLKKTLLIIPFSSIVLKTLFKYKYLVKSPIYLLKACNYLHWLHYGFGLIMFGGVIDKSTLKNIKIWKITKKFTLLFTVLVILLLECNKENKNIASNYS